MDASAGASRARASVGACGVDSPFSQSPQNTAVQRRQLCSLKILRIFSRIHRRGKWGSATLFWVQSIRLPSRNTFVGARTDRTPVLNARTRHSRRRRDVDARRGSRAPHRESRTAGRIDIPRRPIHRLGGALAENRTVAEGFIRPHVFLRVRHPAEPRRGRRP